MVYMKISAGQGPKYWHSQGPWALSLTLCGPLEKS